MNRIPSHHELHSAFLRRVLRKPSSYRQVCERSWTISPSEIRMTPPAIFLEDELERVLGVQEETTLKMEHERLAGGMRENAETRAYLLKDVRLLNGRLLKGAMSHRMSRLADPAPASEEVRMPSVAVSSTLMGSIYFGHWLHDDLSLHLAAQALAPPLEVARQPYSHEAGYRELLALPGHQVARGHFRELFLLDDWGQNADKRRRYEALRSRYRRTPTGSGNSLVYIKRGRTRPGRGRELLNAAALETHLMARGFTVVDPDVMSAQQIATASLDAKLVIGLEGSHLAHAVYPIADQGTLVVIQPPQRFNNVFKDMSDAMGLRYAFTVGALAEGGFTVELERLDRLLDRATGP